MTNLLWRLKEARKLLYIHGMISEQENERAKKRIDKMESRVSQLDALPEEDGGEAENPS